MPLRQHRRVPLYEALKAYTGQDITHFDVPGHKKSNSPHLAEVFGEGVLRMDANSTKDLDLLGKPTGVILEAERLIADAWGSDNAYMLVNGSTSGVQYMIMSACKPRDKIILPRNVHKSAINALILSGAVPVFIHPENDVNFGVANGISVESVKKAIEENTDAKAILVINPTYFGAASDIKGIVKLAHKHKMAVLVDEAHGAHFPFHESFPLSAMEAGADMSTASVHKTGGSLTQSSILLQNEGLIKRVKVRSIINLFQTTSASYLLMASLDLARRNLVLNGKKIYDTLVEETDKAKSQISDLPGLSVLTRENGAGIFDYDPMKIVVNVKELGLTGFEAYGILLSDYRIQCELAEVYTILCVIGTGDSAATIGKLVEALRDLSGRFYGVKEPLSISMADYFEKPKMVVPPSEAYVSPTRLLPIGQAEGEVAGESVMIYPPGIPLVIPGERITKHVIEHYNFYLKQNCVAVNEEDNPGLVKVLGEA